MRMMEYFRFLFLAMAKSIKPLRPRYFSTTLVTLSAEHPQRSASS
jgi:hypothetical protein